MAESRKPTDDSAEKPTDPPPPDDKKPGKTMQELERLQFDALDRAGFDRSNS